MKIVKQNDKIQLQQDFDKMYNWVITKRKFEFYEEKFDQMTERKRPRKYCTLHIATIAIEGQTMNGLLMRSFATRDRNHIKKIIESIMGSRLEY